MWSQLLGSITNTTKTPNHNPHPTSPSATQNQSLEMNNNTIPNANSITTTTNNNNNNSNNNTTTNNDSISNDNNNPNLTSIPLPDLHGKSDILERRHVAELSRFMPARAEGYAWTLAFTTTTMGFSLKSLYRSLSKYEGPVLLIIKDSEQVVFGAFSSCSLNTSSESFYGTGETYLFTFRHNQQGQPQFRRYPWTGDNLYFIMGGSDSLAFGAGDGNFGLWLDEDLFHGSTHSCKTFANEPLTNREDFLVSALECWCFL